IIEERAGQGTEGGEEVGRFLDRLAHRELAAGRRLVAGEQTRFRLRIAEIRIERKSDFDWFVAECIFLWPVADLLDLVPHAPKIVDLRVAIGGARAIDEVPRKNEIGSIGAILNLQQSALALGHFPKQAADRFAGAYQRAVAVAKEQFRG